ncbi:hypothetical protein [Beduini massiliensis]|uniref:hypothetical protein n=1 Tax=Beduini massiliensis TaxID=1585974 RepID=UPI00059A8A96|nr:hypothetical protein [Beduini massiliensis]
MDDDKRNDQDPIDNEDFNEDLKEEATDETEITKESKTTQEAQTEEEPVTEDKNEVEVSTAKEETKKPVSELLYETGKQVGHVSLNYFKHVGSFMKDHVGAIQHIFGYTFKTHILLSIINAFVLSLIPFVLAIKMQLFVHHIGYGKYFQIWGPFLEMMLAVFILSLLFQWLIAFVLTAVEGVVEKHKVSLFRSLKATNIFGIVLDPFIVTGCLLLLLPLNGFIGYLILFIFISGLIFASVMFIKTLVLSRIVSGDHLFSILVLSCVIAFLLMCFIYIMGSIGYKLLFKLYGVYLMGMITGFGI